MIQSLSTSQDEAAVLGVVSSLNDRFWRLRFCDDLKAMAMAQRLAVPETIGRILAGRNVSFEEAETYLQPRLSESLPDPSLMKDMDLAAERVAGAILRRESVAVFGDYDVDGATSAALLVKFFRAVGSSINIYIPDRLIEGYGPNLPALLKLNESGVRLVITVDCGISAHEALAGAADAGLDVIVVDHHLAGPDLPTAYAIVNPNRLDENLTDLRSLAAVGVTFMLVVAINRILRLDGWFKLRPEPDLRQWLDLVALGTVCDVVPLKKINRALVLRGLEVMQKRMNLGIAALSDAGKVRERLDTFHLGFVLGPRVNAGGRVGKSDLGVRLLSTDDQSEAAALAVELDNYNTERKIIEREVFAAALCEVESNHRKDDSIILVSGSGWHPGVIGIVASRLVDRYKRPVFVLSESGKIAKGSGRSVREFDLGAQVIAAKQANILLSGGGHPMAAGLTVEVKKIEVLRSFFLSRADIVEKLTFELSILNIDSIISVDGATPALVGLLELAGPYGAGNPTPRLAINNARVVKVDAVGQDHVRCILSGGSGARLKAIAFRSIEKELGRSLISSQGRYFHFAGQLRLDTWNRSNDVQFIIEDAMPA